MPQASAAPHVLAAAAFALLAAWAGWTLYARFVAGPGDAGWGPGASRGSGL